jgi:hypothetical protein
LDLAGGERARVRGLHRGRATHHGQRRFAADQCAVIARPPIFRGLLTLLAAIGTYYALLFTLAQYLQRGLGHSPLISGLTLVPWVAAYGLAGQIVHRLPPRMIRLAPSAGCGLLTIAYVAIRAVLFSGRHSEALLVPLLGVGGLGLGIQFSAVIAHLTKAVPAEYAADISGVSTTAIQIGGAIGVAAFGTLYLSLTSHTGAADATHAFALTTAAFAAVALLATIAAPPSDSPAGAHQDRRTEPASPYDRHGGRSMSRPRVGGP